MKKTFSLNRLLLQMVLIGFSILLVLLLALDWTSIDNYQTVNRRAWEGILADYTDALDSDLDEVNTAIYSIYSSDSDFEILQDSGAGDVDLYTAAEELYQRIYGTYSMEGQIKGFAILYKNNEKFSGYYDRKTVMNEDLLQIRDKVVENLSGKDNGRYWFYMSINGKNLAVCSCRKWAVTVFMVCSLDEITDEMVTVLEKERGISKGRIKTCFVENNTILFDGEVGEREQELLAVVHSSESHFSEKKDGHFMAGYKISGSRLWLCMDISRSIWSYLNIPQMILLILTAAAILFEITLYRGLRKQLLSPLLSMADQLNRIKDHTTGTENTGIELDTNIEELLLVSGTLNQTLEELTRQKNITYEQTIERQKAQMQYLSMQLKPHFYLNGLKTLNALAMNGERQKIQDIIMRLSYHMRYILQLENEMVFLHDEINYVNNYADLQRDMTDRPLAIVWHIQDDISQWKVPTLCIQTFVENSFKYAKVGNIRSQLLIHISIDELETEDGKFLDINVKDNGSGYPDSTLEVINGDPVENSVSVGINNLKRRCILLYGNWAEYNFYNDEGAVSELILPWK